MPCINRSIEIQAPPTVVWRWLATQGALRRWFSPNLEIDLQVGGAYRFFGPDNRTWISGKVLELKPEDRLILSWIEEGGDWVHPKRLVISLAPTPAGTRVTLTKASPASALQTGEPRWRTTGMVPISIGSWKSWQSSSMLTASSSASDSLFRALAAPTRRRILDLLAEHGQLTVGEIATQFPDLVASGISKHLMELRAAGLVHATRHGRQQIYRIEGRAFAKALAPWLALYEPYWTDALERLRELAESGHPNGSG